jgi:hypothetical protein
VQIMLPGGAVGLLVSRAMGTEKRAGMGAISEVGEVVDVLEEDDTESEE